jgi:hypothetical protein
MRSTQHAVPRRLHEAKLRAGGREPASRQSCGRSRVVTAHSRAAYVAAHGFSAKLDKWSAHLAAVAIRGGQICAAGDGMEVTAHANGRKPLDTATIAFVVAVVDHAVKVGAST